MATDWRRAWLFLAVLAACATSTGVDIAKASLGNSAPAISIAAGIGLAGLVLGGMRLWPAVPLGTFVALHAVGTYPVWAEIIIPLGNGLSAAGGAMALRRWDVNPDPARLRDALALLGAGVLAATVAALAHDVAYNLAAGSESRSMAVLAEWWLSDATGLIATVVLLLTWALGGPLPRTALWWLHLAACLGTTALVSWLIFSDAGQSWIEPYYMLLTLTWAAVSFGLRGASAALAIILFSAAIGTNPYARQITDPIKLQLILQLALLIAVGFGLLLATIVTAHRHAEAALADLNRDLEQRVRTEVAAREAALERAKHAQHMQVLGQIAAGVAHEFNNILQAVRGSLAVIEHRPEDAARVVRFARMALTASERGAIITSRLLGFAHRSAFRRERVETASVLDALRDVLTHTLGGRVAVHLDLQPRLAPLMVDKSELETALISLMTNARDAMPEGGTVTLSARMDIIGTEGHRLAALDAGRYVRIAVSDSGNGMDAATLARAAEPFFTTKPTGSSTGLGLSMAKGFAGQSGGGLTIESAPGRGTIVTMWLPVTDEIGQKPELRPVARLTTPDGKSMPRVLLVDNEEMVRESLAAGLEDAGLSVLVAQSGTEALALLDAGEPIDVLVSDYAMPGMDGLTLIRQAQERRRDLPSVIMTGYIEVLGTKAADKSRDSGLSVLRKPIGAAGLASSIADILVTRERNVGSGRR